MYKLKKHCKMILVGRDYSTKDYKEAVKELQLVNNQPITYHKTVAKSILEHYFIINN